MKKTGITAGLFIALLLTAGISYGQSMYKETRNEGDFDKVVFGIRGELIINFGPEHRIIIEGLQSVLDDIETKVTDGRLLIVMDRPRYFKNDEKVVVRITMPEIKSLSVSGSGKAILADPVINRNLNLNVSGSGRLIAGQLETDDMTCVISGSGNIVIEDGGSVDDADIVISGSGNFSGESLEIDDLTASISGSGSCNCRVNESLEAVISGSGNITYRGNPRIDAKVSGSGRVISAR